MSPTRKISAIQFFISLIITAVLTMLLFLGLKIFIPKPSYPAPLLAGQNCYQIPDQIERQNCEQAAREREQKSQETYQKARESYSGRVFIFANVFGLLLLIIGVIAFAYRLGTNIAIAFILSGGIGITYGYILGWAGANDALKFIVGLIVAALAIGGAVAINRMHERQENMPPTGV